MGERTDYERKFRRAGLPTLVHGEARKSFVRRLIEFFWIVRWALVHGVTTIVRSFALLARTLPILAAFSVVIFLNQEWWQVLSHLSGVKLAILTVAVIGGGSAVILLSLKKRIEDVEAQATLSNALDGSQRRNVGLVMFTAQSIHVFVVTLMIWLVFIGVGAFGVPPDIQADWSGLEATGVDELPDIDPSSGLTATLVVVTFGVALFSGLYLAISGSTNEEYRERFQGEIADQVDDVSAAHAEYLRLLASEEK